MSIPLIQEATKDAINTSIIAIKRNIERINMLLGLVDSGSPDLSGLATKQELEDAVNSLQPVDEVTVGNMQSVSSNAVAKATEVSLNNNVALINGFTCREYVRYSKFGRLVVVDIGGLVSPVTGSGIRWTESLPIIRTRFVQQIFKDNYNSTQNATVYAELNTTKASGHFPAGVFLYGVFMYFTD